MPLFGNSMPYLHGMDPIEDIKDYRSLGEVHLKVELEEIDF